MPEGPEIRRAADKIEAVLKKRAVENIKLKSPLINIKILGKQ